MPQENYQQDFQKIKKYKNISLGLLYYPIPIFLVIYQYSKWACFITVILVYGAAFYTNLKYKCPGCKQRLDIRRENYFCPNCGVKLEEQ